MKPADHTPWTRAEREALRTTYASGGILAAVAALPHRPRSGIYKQARKLGLSRRRRWTPAEDVKLRRLWGSVSLREIGKDLDRTVLTVYWRAQHLGLPLGCPQGWEYLSAAATRTGYSTTQLRRALAFSSVGIQRAFVRTKDPHPRGTRIVEPFDVDRAVEAWGATEPVTDAAHRRGMVDETLRHWLLDAGLEPKRDGRKRSSKAHWRVRSDVIDAVIAERETLTSAADRVGVQHQTLARWLRDAGVDRRKAFVRRSDVDRVVAEKHAGKTRAWRIAA